MAQLETIRRRGRSRSHEALLVLVSLSSVVLAALLAEAAARLYHRDIDSTADNTSYFSWRHRPKLNRLGFRGPEPDALAGDPLVAIVGDSFAFGQGVEEGERFGNLLEGMLRERMGVRHRVLTLARPGAGPEDHLRILEDHVAPLRPELVVLQWFVNDAEVDPGLVRPRPRPLVPSARLTTFLHRHSALYFVANHAWRRLQIDRGWMPSYVEYLDRALRDPAGRPWQLAAEAFRAFAEGCAARGLPLLVVLFPFLTGDEPDEVPLAYLLDRMLGLCRELGIGCLDLRGPFAGVPADRLHVNRFDPHPGPLAHRIAAEALFGPVAAHLRRNAGEATGMAATAHPPAFR